VDFTANALPECDKTGSACIDQAARQPAMPFRH
jgi:hypothetical protein